MNFKKFILLLITHYLLLTTLLLSSIYSIEIPIGGETGGLGTPNIGFVDMDKVFQSYSKVELAKKEYEEKKLEKEEELKLKEKEIKELEVEIEKLKEEIFNQQMVETTELLPKTTVGVQISTQEVTSAELTTKEMQLKEKTDLLSQKQEEYELSKAEVEKFLKEFEESKTFSIMGDLYVIIEELAKEENIAVVVEKSSILYGLPNIDLTNKVIDRLRGK